MNKEKCSDVTLNSDKELPPSLIQLLNVCHRCLHGEDNEGDGGGERGGGEEKEEEGRSDARVDIKHSSFKKVSTFLVSCTAIFILCSLFVILACFFNFFSFCLFLVFLSFSFFSLSSCLNPLHSYS